EQRGIAKVAQRDQHHRLTWRLEAGQELDQQIAGPVVALPRQLQSVAEPLRIVRAEQGRQFRLRWAGRRLPGRIVPLLKRPRRDAAYRVGLSGIVGHRSDQRLSRWDRATTERVD